MLPVTGGAKLTLFGSSVSGLVGNKKTDVLAKAFLGLSVEVLKGFYERTTQFKLYIWKDGLVVADGRFLLFRSK